MTTEPRRNNFKKIPTPAGALAAKNCQDQGGEEGGDVDELGDNEGVGIFSNYFLYVVQQASMSA